MQMSMRRTGEDFVSHVKDSERTICRNKAGSSSAKVIGKSCKVHPIKREGSTSKVVSSTTQPLSPAKATRQREKAVALRS